MNNFLGEIIIYDNNSKTNEKKLIQEYLKKYKYNNKLIFSKKNKGIARGRNMAVKYASKDWIMFLDNDLFFIKNPLNELENITSEMGYKFINISAYNKEIGKIYAHGGNFNIEKYDTKIAVSSSTCKNEENTNYFISDFLFGGLCMVNLDSFMEMGCFDKKFFVGYEDVDFSLKCEKLGIKIANTGEFYLVHDHKILNDKTSIKYERKRFNIKRIKKSIKWFEKKNRNLTPLTKSERSYINEKTTNRKTIK